MARWLRRIGHRPQRAGITANVDCTELALRRLEDRLGATARVTRRPVAVVGQSRGGSLARVLAVRRPDLISTVVTLGSPLADQFAVHPFVTAHIRAVSFLGSAGVPGMFTRLCEDGPCCADARKQAIGPFPESVRFVAVYSRSDGIVDWQACLDPAAELVEVRSSHCGMSVHPAVFEVVARSLAPTGTATAVAPPPLRLL
jgi:pimeloyl-ACP methyl ester carboxylesterase